MRALIWKEFRLCWPILLLGGILLAFPYAVFLGQDGHHWRSGFHADSVIDSCVGSVFIAMFTLAVLGGNAVAGERNDRSAEFLACLPVSRAKNLASKLMWPVITMVSIIGVNACVLYSLNVTIEDFTMFRVGASLVIAATICCLSFSAAWMCSSCFRSPTFAVAGGLVSPLLLIVILGGVWKVFFGSGAGPSNIVFVRVGLTVAGIFFAAGCFHYLRRVEP